MKKKINFAIPKNRTLDQEVDQWVKTGNIKNDLEEQKIENITDQVCIKEDSYRLSLDIPRYLHRRIKKICAVEGVSMKEKLNKLLLETFPEK